MTTIVLENINEDLLERFTQKAEKHGLSFDSYLKKIMTETVEQTEAKERTFLDALMAIPKLEGYTDEEIDEIFGRREDQYSPHRELNWGEE